MTQQGDTDTDFSREPEMVCAPVTGELLEIQQVAAPEVFLAAEGHIVLILPAGEVVTGSMAATAAAEVDRLAGHRKLPLLLILTGVEALTRSARTVFSNAGSLEAAAVVGVSPVDRVIANFLLGGGIQPCPTRYFSAEPDALAWLRRKHAVA